MADQKDILIAQLQEEKRKGKEQKRLQRERTTRSRLIKDLKKDQNFLNKTPQEQSILIEQKMDKWKIEDDKKYDIENADRLNSPSIKHKQNHLSLGAVAGASYSASSSILIPDIKEQPILPINPPVPPPVEHPEQKEQPILPINPPVPPSSPSLSQHTPPTQPCSPVLDLDSEITLTRDSIQDLLFDLDVKKSYLKRLLTIKKENIESEIENLSTELSQPEEEEV